MDSGEDEILVAVRRLRLFLKNDEKLLNYLKSYPDNNQMREQFEDEKLNSLIVNRLKANIAEVQRLRNENAQLKAKIESLNNKF